MKKNYSSPIFEIKNMQAESVLALSAVKGETAQTNPTTGDGGAIVNGEDQGNGGDVLTREEVESEWDN